MDKYGLQTWHDYVSLGLLIGFAVFSSVFLFCYGRTGNGRKSR